MSEQPANYDAGQSQPSGTITLSLPIDTARIMARMARQFDVTVEDVMVQAIAQTQEDTEAEFRAQLSRHLQWGTVLQLDRIAAWNRKTEAEIVEHLVASTDKQIMAALNDDDRERYMAGSSVDTEPDG